MTKKYTHQVIFCIVNSGYSDAVMEAAKTAGVETNDEFLNNYHKTVNSPILDRPPSVYSK